MGSRGQGSGSWYGKTSQTKLQSKTKPGPLGYQNKLVFEKVLQLLSDVKSNQLFYKPRFLFLGLLAISLFLLKKRESMQIPVGLIIISGWGWVAFSCWLAGFHTQLLLVTDAFFLDGICCRIPALLVGVLLITGKHNGDSIDSAFFYGKEQVGSYWQFLSWECLVSWCTLIFLY